MRSRMAQMEKDRADWIESIGGLEKLASLGLSPDGKRINMQNLENVDGFGEKFKFDVNESENGHFENLEKSTEANDKIGSKVKKHDRRQNIQSNSSKNRKLSKKANRNKSKIPRSRSKLESQNSKIASKDKYSKDNSEKSKANLPKRKRL